MDDDQPSSTQVKRLPERSTLMRGLLMILFLFLFGLAETVLAVATIIQFFWILVKDEPNESIAQFGKNLANWVSKTVLFQTGSTEELPFPWSKWDR